MADSYPIRPVSREEFQAFRYVDDHAFHVAGRLPERTAISLRLFEPGRSLAAFDPAAESFAVGAGARGGDIVGTAGAFSFQMTVPGAVLPVAGVSYVSVLPTYRRRGIQRSLMQRQLTDIAAGGAEPVAALWASEAPLYGKYGYGLAASVAVFRFGRGEGSINVPVDPALTLRLVPPAEAIPELATVYDAARRSRPGFFARPDVWWDIATFDHEAVRGGFGPLRCVLAWRSWGTARVRALPRAGRLGRRRVPAGFQDRHQGAHCRRCPGRGGTVAGPAQP